MLHGRLWPPFTLLSEMEVIVHRFFWLQGHPLIFKGLALPRALIHMCTCFLVCLIIDLCCCTAAQKQSQSLANIQLMYSRSCLDVVNDSGVQDSFVSNLVSTLVTTTATGYTIQGHCLVSHKNRLLRVQMISIYHCLYNSGTSVIFCFIPETQPNLKQIVTVIHTHWCGWCPTLVQNNVKDQLKQIAVSHVHTIF